MKAVSAVSVISDSIIKRKVPGEPVVEVKTNGLKVEAQRNSPSELCEMLSQNKTKNSKSDLEELDYLYPPKQKSFQY